MLFYLLLVVSVILIYYWKNKNSDYWKKKDIIQVDGVVWKFMTGNRSVPELFKEIYDENDTHVGVFMGSIPTLVLKDLEDVQAVLAGDFQSFYNRGIEYNSNDLLSDNLLFMGDLQKWKCLRQKLTPVFTSAKLKNMFYIMDKCAKDFVEFIDEDEHMKNTPFKALYRYTTAALGASVFGIDTNLKSTMDTPFLDMAWSAVEPSFRLNAVFLISSVSPFLFKLFKLRIFGEHEDFFIGAVKSVIRNRKNSTEKTHDFIDMCVELQKQGVMRDPSTGYELEPIDEVLAAQAFFFFLAGADTSANTMQFALLMLASNQDVLAKVHKEIDSVIGNDVKELTITHIEKLQYLDMVLSESMRIYPTIGSINRKCTKTTILPGSKVKIEKDTVVVIPVFGIHRDEKYFPDPDVFDPERFAPENLSKIKKYSYLPFGEGNRICIGARFARLQVKVGLAWLLRRYTLAERKYQPEHFERSTFSIRDTQARFDLIRREL